MVLTPVVNATNQLVSGKKYNIIFYFILLLFFKDVNQKIDDGDSQLLKKIKKIGGATIDATSTAFNGLSGGVGEIGDAIGGNTRNIVEKKLGEETSNTFLGENKK